MNFALPYNLLASAEMTWQENGSSGVKTLLTCNANGRQGRHMNASLSIKWFDIFVLVLLIVGIFHGRKRGMSVELLPLLQLLIIVVVGSRLYEPIAKLLNEWTNSALTPMLAAICAYVLFGLVVHFLFTRIKRAVGEKLVGSDIFGGMEYYFGMFAGMLRYACYLMIGMAILHAKPIDKEAERAYRKTEQDNLGNITFPTYTSIQEDVFEESEVGKLVKTHVGHLLLKPSSGKKPNKNDAIARKRERAVEEVMSNSNPSPPKAQ